MSRSLQTYNLATGITTWYDDEVPEMFNIPATKPIKYLDEDWFRYFPDGKVESHELCFGCEPGGCPFHTKIVGVDPATPGADKTVTLEVWFCGGYCSKGSEPCPGHTGDVRDGNLTTLPRQPEAGS